jgi:uncharacterized protein DUF547
MKIKKKKSLVIIAILIFLGITGGNASSAAVDNRIFADLLKNYVKDGVVDYAGFKRNESRLDAYLRMLEGVNTGTLERRAQFAFYVNAYNAWTIKLILTGYPGVESIKDLGSVFKSPWKKEIVRLDGDSVSLDHVEHEILRPRFKDARVHFAINCASRGCPPLFAEPFQGDILEQQLDTVTGAFLNDPGYNRLDGNTLYVSRIFKWFKEDFNKDIVGFFLKYAEGPLKKGLAAGKDSLKIKYLDYDWSLNGK